MSCIFCEIIAQWDVASRVYQDDHVLAFMDIRPVRPGQLVIVPKRHIDHFSDLPDELAIRMLLLGQRISRAMQKLLEPRRVGMVVHGFGVPHAHLVVLPLQHPWDITSSANAYVENSAVKFKWELVPLADRTELDALAARLAEALEA